MREFEEHSILLLEEELKEGVGGREFDLNFPKKYGATEVK